MLSRVYPRVCGGTQVTDRFAGGHWGLSPRVRGNLQRRYQHNRRLGSIPACAGEPSSWLDTQRSGRVYPRVCGGTIRHTKTAFRTTGLSPRVRGNLPLSPARVPQSGSIPACAGEPDIEYCHVMHYEVYPRVCGGTRSGPGRPGRPWGLSPRVRGNPVQVILDTTSAGSIPACAGEPRASDFGYHLGGVYPRVCGGTRWTLLTARMA